MNCTVAHYKDRQSASRVKRKVLRSMNIHTNVSYCSMCDCYHVDATGRKNDFSPTQLEILRYLAEGYTDIEISSLINIQWRGVEASITRMKQRLYALSRTNLVAIAISLGIVDPNDFVPQEKEKMHT